MVLKLQLVYNVAANIIAGGRQFDATAQAAALANLFLRPIQDAIFDL